MKYIFIICLYNLKKNIKKKKRKTRFYIFMVKHQQNVYNFTIELVLQYYIFHDRERFVNLELYISTLQ